MGELLERQHKFYIRNEQELRNKYGGQFIVIQSEKVVESFGSERDAYIYCVKHFQIGTFLIRKIKAVD
ncbi:hypothetical protein [Ekhidna sp. To15]|uniref:hypothetical protein n=1 Tax=Ekhidna sp. To15 TaxID=3395267 RepID=UPI003F51B136